MMREGFSQTATELRVLYTAIVLLVGGFFLYSVRGLLVPFVLYLLLLALLLPYAGTRRHRLLAVTATLLMALWFLSTLGSLLAPFILAFILAYILDPAVDALERRRVRRGAAIAILLLPVLALITGALVFGIPALADQLDALIDNLPLAVERLERWWQGVIAAVQRMNVPFLSEEALARRMRDLDGEGIAAFVRERQDGLLRSGWNTLGRGVGIVVTVIGYLVVTPVVLVYLLLDFDRVRHAAMDLLPASRRESIISFISDYDALLSRFLRGQVLAASIVGLLTWLGLLIVGFPLSGLVGAIAGVFNLVPYLGLIASVIPVIIIALFSGSFLGSLLKAGIVFAIVQFIDGSITGPRITGSSVGLHPVWVMLALAVGGYFFGFVGILLAMPAAVLVKLSLIRALKRYRASALYNEPEIETEL
ncbi:MAG: AI-2E family transporter [Candidatus Cloacimonetes bacterium]|jgi:predicted PurR-regulated permease PerM|nr:AI-2E family transporter [Candidatus Cloacimonadota bacterium]